MATKYDQSSATRPVSIRSHTSAFQVHFKHTSSALEMSSVNPPTVVAVVSSQQNYFSNFCEYEVITFCQSRECLKDKQHKMPQSRQKFARQVARIISQCIRAFKDYTFSSPLHL